MIKPREHLVYLLGTKSTLIGIINDHLKNQTKDIIFINL